jgi:import inner membrane translocase subunit TIM22
MSNIFSGRFPSGLQIYAKGQEPLPPGLSDDDRPAYEQNKKWERYMVTAMESCPAKTVMAGGAGTPRLLPLWLACLAGVLNTLHLSGLGIGAFFSLMSASFAYEDPVLRQQTQAKYSVQRARDVFKEMGRGMWSTGKGFGKVGALFAGIECVIESVGELFLKPLCLR